MCEFFSCIAHRDGRILFTDANSHEVIIRAANLTDDRIGQDRDWVRLECRPGVNGDAWQHIVDDREPVWWRLRGSFMWERIEQIASAVLPAWEAFDAAIASYTLKLAWANIFVPPGASEAYLTIKRHAQKAYRQSLEEIPGYVA